MMSTPNRCPTWKIRSEAPLRAFLIFRLSDIGAFRSRWRRGGGAMGTGGRGSDLFDLPVLEFQRRRASEDRRDDSDNALVGDDLVDLAFEVLECAVVDLDLVALLELGGDAGGLVHLGGGVEHLVLVLGAHGGGLAVGADEVAHA